MRFRDCVFFLALCVAATYMVFGRGQIQLPDSVQHALVAAEDFFADPMLVGGEWGRQLAGAFSDEIKEQLGSYAENLSPSLALVEERASELMPEYYCQPNKKKAISKTVGTQIYKWVDEAGRVHYGDSASVQTSIAEEIHVEGRVHYFNLNLHADDKGFPTHFADRLRVRVEKAYQFLAQLVPASLLSQVDVNLWIFNSEQGYTDFYNQHASGLASLSQGFHSSKDNIAAAWRKTDEQVLTTGVHEAVHVMNSEMFGAIPRWLNEGLAEYIEDVHVYGQAADIRVADDLLHQLRGNRLDLTYVLQADSEQWQGAMREDLYAHSWGLVYMLMSSAQGRELLKDFLVASAQNPCELLDAHDYFHRGYPGGLQQLERQFRSWLAGSKAPHRL